VSKGEPGDDRDDHEVDEVDGVGRVAQQVEPARNGEPVPALEESGAEKKRRRADSGSQAYDHAAVEWAGNDERACEDDHSQPQEQVRGKRLLVFKGKRHQNSEAEQEMVRRKECQPVRRGGRQEQQRRRQP
jgi:hypothetical protein